MSGPSIGDVIADRYEIKGEPVRFPGYTEYRAFDREVEVEVALWWVDRAMFPGRADRARFLSAAAHVRRMRNDNARRLFDVAEIGDRLYATVQLATGERLQDRVTRGDEVSDRQLLEYAGALCEALSRAHDVALVHGRLVPQDIVTVSGLLKVGGIGLWHCAGSATKDVWGTGARYVAPEAWSRAQPGPAADVFSAAVILAELACRGGGEQWNNTGDVRELKDELVLMRSDIASELTDALEADPARRADSPTALLASLRAALGADTPRGHAVDEAKIDIFAESGFSPSSEETTRYIRQPREHPSELRDVEVAEPQSPAAPRRVSPRPIPLAPPPTVEKPPNVRETGQALPMPLVAEPSRAFHIASVREKAETSLPTAPFDRPDPAPDPPRTQPMAPRKRGVWRIASVAAAAVGAALIAWVALNERFGGDRGDATVGSGAKPEPNNPIAVAPASVIRTGPCPEAMVQVESYCIDAYESPGAGRRPETGMSYAAAQHACADRGARLCEPAEWERACRGPKGWSFPHGTSYRRTQCNADKGGKAEIGVAGSFDCMSVEGVHDLSGNVAEWVTGARPRGGSASDGTDGRCSRRRKPDQHRAHDDVGYRCCADAK